MLTRHCFILSILFLLSICTSAICQGRVIVPYVVEHQIEQAKVILKKSELIVGEIREEVTDFPAGTVVDQSPPAGDTVEIGDFVNLVISISQERVETRHIVIVPNVVGYDTVQAKGILEESELRVGEIREKVTDSPAGTVVEQGPPARDTVEIGTPVNLVISISQERVKTPHIVMVPNVVGYDTVQAKEILKEVGLRVGELERRISDLEAGTIVEQDPPAGEKVPIGTSVNLMLVTKESKVVLLVGLIGGFILVLGIGYFLFLKVKKQGKTGEHIKPNIRLRPKKDIGTQQVESDTPIQSDFKVHLRSVSDLGTQDIESKGFLIIDDKRRERE